MKSNSAVALNGRFSGTLAPTGTQTAAFGLFDAIIRTPGRRVPLVVFADPRFPGVAGWADVRATTLAPVPLSEWSRSKAQLWEQMTLPRLCRRYGCAAAHHPITTSPAFGRGVKSIVTLHDLNFWQHPEWYSRAFRAAYTFTAIPGLLNAERVVTISNYVRGQAEKRLGIEPSRLRRIYNGVRFAGDGREPFAHTDTAYILCVGSLQPHKNLPRLLEAFRLLRAEEPALELWIAGRPQQHFAAIPGIRELLESPGVEVLGYLSDADLHAAYLNARAFCYPSLEEGFGLPVLEAMACGTPVVTSNCSCLPEIAGGHAELVDPLSVEAIAAGLRTVLEMPAASREERVESAREWARTFTWEQAAREYLEIYAELL